MLLQGIYLSDFWPFRLHTETKDPQCTCKFLPSRERTCRARSFALKRKCLLKLDRERSCRKYGLNCCFLTRTGQGESPPQSHTETRLSTIGLALKIQSLKPNPSYNPNAFRRTREEDWLDFETSPNYNNWEASQGLCGKLSSKTKPTNLTGTNGFTVCNIRIPNASAAPQALMGSEPTGYHSHFCSKPLQMLCLTMRWRFPRLFSQKTLDF